jgi:hypothetical protein
MTQNAIAGALRPPAASSAIRTRTTARCGAVARRAVLPLMRLRYAGSASTWGLAVCRASHDDYEKSLLPRVARWRPQEALDCACGLYLGDHTAWITPPPRRINRRTH